MQTLQDCAGETVTQRSDLTRATRGVKGANRALLPGFALRDSTRLPRN
jgi:hypothetical protein